jgi:hypothetical protein
MSPQLARGATAGAARIKAAQMEGFADPTYSKADQSQSPPQPQPTATSDDDKHKKDKKSSKGFKGLFGRKKDKPEEKKAAPAPAPAPAPATTATTAQGASPVVATSAPLQPHAT